MSGYLLDTNVLSEFRKGRRANASLLEWANSTLSEDHFISVLALGEIRKGIERIRRRDPAQAVVLDVFLEKTEAEFEDRILPVSKAVATQWGRFDAIRPIPVADGLMAATASVHSLTFVTRNVADVLQIGVPILNPFEFVPE